MGWFSRSSKPHSDISELAANPAFIDVTDVSGHTTVDVTLSIHASPPNERRFGAALCMLTRNNRTESTGSVVTIGGRPHNVTRTQFNELLEEAARSGHLIDGFLDIEATVDLKNGNITWQPENGEGVALNHLDMVVENTIASLVETNVFGEWFAPTSVDRRSTIHPETAY